jgi:hypothetical protein
MYQPESIGRWYRSTRELNASNNAKSEEPND